MLKLHGRFPRDTDGEEKRDFRPTIINGHCRGKKITLYQAREWGSYDEQSSFSASWMLVGKNLRSEGEIKPQELSVGYTYLERWALDEPPFEVEWGSSEGGTKTMTYIPPEDVEVRLSHKACSITLVHFDSPDEWGNGMATWGYSCRIFIRPDTPQTLEWYAEVVFSLSDLLSCMVGRRSVPTGMGYAPFDRGEETEEGLVQGTIEIFPDGFKAPSDVTVPENRSQPLAVLVPLSEIRSNLETVFSSWFAWDEQLSIARALLLAVMDDPSVYAEYRCLALAQALELLHRRMAASGTYLEDEEFAEVKAKLLDALPESMPSEIKDAFRGKLKYLNEVSLRRRLKDLLNGCDEGTKQAITNSPKEFVDQIVDIRNYLTHYGEPPRGGVPTAFELLETAANMRSLLVAVLFKELDVSAETTARSIEKIEPLPVHWHR